MATLIVTMIRIVGDGVLVGVVMVFAGLTKVFSGVVFWGLHSLVPHSMFPGNCVKDVASLHRFAASSLTQPPRNNF